MREGWRNVRLGEVLEHKLDRVPVVDSSTYPLAGVFSFGRGLFWRDPLDGSKTSYKHMHRLHAGDLVMSKLKAWEGALAVVPDEFDGAILSPEFPTFRVGPELLSSYLSLVVSTDSFASRLQTESRGVGGRRERVHPSRLLEVEVGLPSVAEQKRIVDLLGALDAVRQLASLEEAAGERLYRSLLANSFSADLPKRLLGEVATSRLGKMLSRVSKTGDDEQRYVRNANVQWDLLRLEDLSTMAFTEAERKEFALRQGDVLICEGGEVGRTAVVERDLPDIYFQKAIHRVRCGPTLLPRYLLHFMRFASLNGEFDNFATQSTIQHLTGEKLARLPVPQPSIDVQAAAVELLDSVLAGSKASESLHSATVRASRTLFADLMSGEHEIPTSYDELLAEAG